jgi:hypothetical protein
LWLAFLKILSGKAICLLNEKTMKKSLLLSAVAVALIFGACKKSSNNNTTYSTAADQAAMSYELVAANTNYAFDSVVPVANIVWDTALATPDVIIFQATDSNVQIQLKATNTEQINLMSSVAMDFGNFTLPSGKYTKTKLTIDLDKTGNQPDLELNGRVTNGSVTLPVEVMVDESVQLQTDEDSITITNDSSYIAATTLDLSSVTAGITANMLLNAKLTNGVIIISSSSNQNLYMMILHSLGAARPHCSFMHYFHH